MLLLEMFLLPNFKKFGKALNKRIIFPLDRKSVSAVRNEKLVRLKNCFQSQGYLTNLKNVSDLPKNSFY